MQQEMKININIELDGYDKIKEQLNDVENQIDRILEKSKKIGSHESMQEFLNRKLSNKSQR